MVNLLLPLNPIWQPSLESIKKIISADDFFESLEYFLRNKNYNPDKASFLYAIKDNSGIRPISSLSVIDRLVYQAILNPSILGNRIDKRMLGFCFGNRVDGKDNNYLCNYRDDWGKFCGVQKESFDDEFRWQVTLDVNEFYPSIHQDKLFGILEEEFSLKNEKVFNILKKQLDQWSEIKNLSLGIPQGPNVSGVLANAYLYPLDKFADSLVEKDLKYARFVDDIVLTGKNKKDVIGATHELSLFLRDV